MNLLGTNQLLISIVAGYIQIQWMNKYSAIHQRTPMMIQHIFRDMLFIGICRFITVILGLIAIKGIAVSLVATIKSFVTIVYSHYQSSYSERKDK